MKKDQTLILTGKQIEQKIVSMAHHIHENHYKSKELFLVGITGRGVELANRISKVIGDISDLKISVNSIELDKDHPLENEMKYSGDTKLLRNKVVILIDDVLNSGQTIMYAIKFLLDASPSVIATAILIDRFYRRYPIHADYVGLTLSTNLKEHVTVDFTRGKECAYLT